LTSGRGGPKFASNFKQINGGLMKRLIPIFAALILTTGPASFADKKSAGPTVVELGCLSTTNNEDNLIHGEFSATSPNYEIRFEVCTIPADRTNLLAYIKTYWNKSPGISLLDPNEQVHSLTGTVVDPNQSKALYINIPAQVGSYVLHLSGNGSKYTFFAGALMTSKSDFNAP
jgi:hypothetical protein